MGSGEGMAGSFWARVWLLWIGVGSRGREVWWRGMGEGGSRFGRGVKRRGAEVVLREGEYRPDGKERVFRSV